MEKSHKSAMIIAPPISLCDQIQEIRRKHDRAYERWMPHINMVYPFYEDKGNVFAKEVRKLTMQLSGIKPFKVSFTKESIGFFRHNTRTVVWIRPLMPTATQSAPETKTPKTPKPKKIAKPKVVQPPAQRQPVRKMPDPKPVVLAPKSFPKPAIPAVQLQQHTLIGYPDPVPANTRNYAPATGLDVLCMAVWTPEDTQRDIRIAQQSSAVGLDALRFAFCGLPEGKEQTDTSQGNQQQDSQRYMTFTKVLSDVAPVQQEATQDAFSRLCEQDSPILPVKVPSSVASSSDESVTSDTETSEEDERDNFAEALPPRPDGHHPHVMHLQQELERNYPDLNDLGSRSETGFQPHLTLGQFDNWTAQTFIADLKKTFVDVTFEVNEMQMISRVGNLEPFKVKMTVPLGGNQASILI